MSIIKEVKLDFEDSTKAICKYLVFDVETTGLPINRYASPNDFKNWPYVVQIAWLLFDDEYKLIEHNNFYLKQPVEIPADATNIHGITTTMMLEKGVEPSNVYANFKKVVNNTEYLICHNIDFEIPIIHSDFLRNGMQWNFPDNKMFCTMKTGTKFCKIPPYKNGEYKWPTLVELYQKCFFPNDSIKRITNMHNANIDAAMTAQCFFKLKELGLFKEIGTNATANNIAAEQIEENFEDLHNILDKWDSDNCYWSYYKIEHKGLGVTRVIRDDYTNCWGFSSFSNPKIAAQFKKWDIQWAKICHNKKSQADREASLNIAEERTREAREKQKQIDDLLINALSNNNRTSWDSLKDTKKYTIPNPKNNLETELCKIRPPTLPIFKELPQKPEKRFDLIKPQFSLVDKFFKSQKEKKIKQAETISERFYHEEMTAWKKSVDEINFFNLSLKEQYEQQLKEFEEQKQIIKNHFDVLEKNWGKEKETYYNNQKEHNDKIEKFKDNYFQKNTKAVIQYCEIVLNNSEYPETFPKDFDLGYNSDSNLLIVDYVLPAPEDLPTLAEVKYIASKKIFKELFLSETQLSKNYDSVIYKMTLRTLHELFEADRAEALESVIFNGWVNTIDKSTGKKINTCIVSIQTKKIDFKEVNLLNVDPKTCFKYFKGIGSNKLSSIIAVQPIAQSREIEEADTKFK
ncbi:MAG: 3'-5' exonuclease [Nitrospirae bacterium]|nr:3'-5' exonuclease [Nitrospirota bacterium]